MNDNRCVGEEFSPLWCPKQQEANYGQLLAIGVASFGPVDLKQDSPTFGFVTSTLKPNWTNADIIGPLKNFFDVPIGFDTDVNGAALAEGRWGAAQGLHTFVYLTIGTGIVGGAMVNGKLLRSLLHPEMGHIRLNHDWTVDPYPGFCPYHGDCLEGMAAGPAIEKRWRIKGQDVEPDHPAWELETDYLAQALQKPRLCPFPATDQHGRRGYKCVRPPAQGESENRRIFKQLRPTPVHNQPY